MYKEKQKDKDEIQIHKFWKMFKQLHINITLADALILQFQKYQKCLKPLLLPIRRNFLELANYNPSMKICPSAGMFLFSVRRFSSLLDFSFIDELKVIPQSALILGRPFLRTLAALIDVHGEEMILVDDYLEDLFANEKMTNHLSGNPTFSLKPDTLTSDLTSPEFKDDIFDPEGDIVLIKELLNLDSLPRLSSLFNYMFTDEHTLDYSSLPRYDDANDDLFDLKTDSDEWGKIFYDDPFDSKENKIKVSKLLVDELDSTGSSSFLPHFLECDSVLD
ncbi:hypothetical protein Tco_0383312 [Tanacetum coccineum]